MIGKSATGSRLIQGLLIENINPGSRSAGDLKHHLGASAKGQIDSECRVKRNREGLILSALFDVSMAGDLPDGMCVCIYFMSFIVYLFSSS